MMGVLAVAYVFNVITGTGYVRPVRDFRRSESQRKYSAVRLKACLVL